eukprot:TRINITY_DN31127_c0_g1_i1.p1 TRINITY_DN31127_c0_g1~~TRINITY_DN31127_c0_g1_i1.p1  ORF type:complete len:520 (+),score=88.21 TRINITY_DN31127_c0_g1_i1:60-1619(+)
MEAASVDMLIGMGFLCTQAERALQLEGGNLQRAADLLLTNPPPLESHTVDVDADDDDVTRNFGTDAGLTESAGDPKLSCLLEMGFSHSAAKEALQRNAGDLEAAMESLIEQGQHSQHERPQAIVMEEDPEEPEEISDVARQESPTEPVPGLGLSDNTAGPAASSPTEQTDQLDSAKLIKEFTVAHLSSNLTFGPAAFGKLRRDAITQIQETTCSKSVNVKQMLEASVRGVSKMTGERGIKQVTQMLTDCYKVGLFMHGPATSPVNRQIIPAMHHIFAELSKHQPQDGKRVSHLTALAHACQDCQQVQAREIMRIFGDLTSQNDTFEGQLKYSLVRQKEAALDRYISRRHANCDLDHTRVNPWQQRAHLISGYVALIGDEFGLDGVTAAHSDRFLSQVRGEIGRTRARDVVAELKQDMCAKEWLQTLLADINNQTSGSERLINRDCIFKWVQENMSEEASYLVFYDEDRSPEFEDLDPKAPLEENRYQPFLSPKVLVEMLLKATMLEEKQEGPNKKRRKQ